MSQNKQSGYDRSSHGILLEAGNNEVEFLEFILGGQLYGVNVAKVSQTLVWREQRLIKTPGVSNGALGVVYFRGEPIVAIDLKEFLGMQDRKSNVDPENLLLLVLEFNRRRVGFLVDSVEGIRRVTWSEFHPIEDYAGMFDEVGVIGTVTLGERVVMILDVEAIMVEFDPRMGIDYYTSMIAEESVIDRSSINVVYAEDSLLIQKKTIKTLKEIGFQNLTVFSNGLDALSYVEATEPTSVDIILSDIEMPEMDGLTFCNRVKSNPRYQHIPFVFFSSLINDQMERKCKSMKAEACYSKPEIHVITQAIEKFVLKARNSRKFAAAKAAEAEESAKSMF